MKLFSMHYARRVFCFVLGLALCGFGAALCTRPELGTSPIAALPYVMTFLSPLSFGMWTVILNCLFLLAQIVIQGRDFKIWQLAQLPATCVLGAFIDLGMWATAACVPESYWLRLAEVVLGCAITAFGISLEVAASLTYLPGDGLIKTIVDKWKLNFGTVKIISDIVLVIAAFAVIFLSTGTVEGLREGTLVAAFLVGYIMRLTDPFFAKLRSWLGV